MEGNVVCSYLRKKFSSTLEKAEADLSSSSQIIARFRSIESLMIINKMKQNSASMVEVLYDLLDALSECTIFSHKRRAGAASNKGIMYLFRLVRFENKMKSRLDKIERNLRDIGPADQHQIGGNAEVVTTIQQPHPDPSLIEGFESQVREIEDMIMSDSLFTPIGIVGMCGSGKTALAQKVFSNLEKKFFPRIWVGLSETMYKNEGSDLREKILNQILREIGHDASDLEYGDYSVVQLLEKLRLRLEGKRYLIVLDDAWRLDEWFADLGCCTDRPEAESFTSGLPKQSGGAVIITSRGENVIRRMAGEKHVIRPQLSHKNICWTIFINQVEQLERIDPKDERLNKMKDCVINNCQGLPLAAKTLANVISDLLAAKTLYQINI